MKTTYKARLHISALAAMLLSATASASPITLVGSTVSFRFDDALLGLYGAASVSGDNLFFTPPAFRAQSVNDTGLVTVNPILDVSILANAGYALSAASLVERGDYFLHGNNSSVNIIGSLLLTDADNAANSASDSLMLDAVMNVVSDFPHITVSDWTANASVLIPGNGWGGVDGIVGAVNLNLNTELQAQSSTRGQGAFIQSKFIGLTAQTVAVPEPGTLALLGIGILGFAARIRRSTPA